MDIEIREFITYLHDIKKTSTNTEISYKRDLKKMAEFLEERGIRNYKDVKELDLLDLVDDLTHGGAFAGADIEGVVLALIAVHSSFILLKYISIIHTLIRLGNQTESKRNATCEID